MLIVDAQVHVWGANTTARPWHPERAHLAHKAVPFSKGDLLQEMDAAGVDRAVLVPPSWEGDRNDLAIEAARLHPSRFAIMGRLPIETPVSQAIIEGWKQQPGMLGMRFTFHTPSLIKILAEGGAEWLFEAAEKAGIPLMVLPRGSLPLIDKVAERHPGLRLVIDHMAVPGGVKDAAAFAHLPDLLKLAKRANVAVKASGLAEYTSEAYPFRGLQTYIRQAYDAFGPKRVFWGTDLTRMPISYRQCVTHFTEELPFLNASDKEWIMGRGICDWLGWK